MVKTRKTPKQQQERNAANSLNKAKEHQATRGRCTWEFSLVGLSPSLKTWAGCLDENVAFEMWKEKVNFPFGVVIFYNIMEEQHIYIANVSVVETSKVESP